MKQNNSKHGYDMPANFTKHHCQNDSTFIMALQEIRDMAWHKAVKYRFDPVIGRIHDEYLNMLNEMIKGLAA